MAINFPTSLDTLSNPNTTDQLNSPSHAGQHSDINDAVEALEAKVGANSSAVESSHDYKLSTVTGSNKAETQANKRTSFQATPTDTAYPSEKLVKDSLNGKIGSVVEDTTPQLGGQLDVNGQALGDGTLEILKFSETASAVNEITVKNAATGNAPEIQATGDDTNIDLKLVGKGTGGTIARIKPRLVTAASYTTDTGTSLNCDTTDQFEITAQAGALKFNNPGGTPTGGQKLTIRIKDSGAARALTYDTKFRAMGVALPTTTVLSKTLYMGFIYNATDTKWDLVAVAQEE